MDERQLVRLAQEGSREAFSRLVERYQPKVFHMALSFTRNRESADDLAQEVFLKAFLALPKFRHGSEFGTWLYRITVNHAKDYLRRRGRAKEVPLETAGEVVETRPGEAEVREELRETERRRTLIHEALAALPDKYRVILTLRDVEGMPYEKIAEVLEVSPGTVDSRLHRARKMLRKRIQPVLVREGGLHAL